MISRATEILACRLGLCVMLAALFLRPVLAQDAAQAESSDAAIRVLVTYGGHGFAEAEFWSMFDKMPGIQYDRAELPQSFELLKPDLADQYDVIVRYDMLDGMTAQQREAFVRLLRDRGIGLVAWHHNLGSHRNWAEYREIIGGSYLFEPIEIGGRAYPASTYRHWDSTTYKPVVGDHPITHDVQPFRVLHGGETYNKCYVADDVQVLLTTDQQDTNPQQMWVKKYGRSRVCYLMPGHGPEAWGVEDFRKLLRQAIIWTGQSG